MENSGSVHRKIDADEVISKLKDDGDFDKLRLKIIRKLKENEDLRNSIISMVKQSAALNCPGVESMKPWQLSDAIHQEVGDKVMSQVSDSLWEIIRSSDGMKSEITETVRSVYNKLLNPRGNEERGSSSLNSLVPVQKQADNITSQTASPDEVVGMSDNEPEEPPGFSLLNKNNHMEQPKEELQLPMPHHRRPVQEQSKESNHTDDEMDEDSGPPGFCPGGESKQPCGGSDDDPDVPPGFG